MMTDQESETPKAEGDDEFRDGVVDTIRMIVRQGLGFNSTFVDDDVRVAVGLAQRAVLVGLASDFSADMQKRMMEASGRCRVDHAKSLIEGRRQSFVNTISNE